MRVVLSAARPRRLTVALAVVLATAVAPGTAVAGTGYGGGGHGGGHGGGQGGGAGLADLDLDAATIPQLQHWMEHGRFTAADLAQAYLDRIAELDPQLGSVLALNEDALRDAAASDREREVHGARSPLEGIPVLLKDNVDKEGMPTTAGSLALVGTRPDDATLTARLEDAGAIVLGKANLSEWANIRSTHATSGWSGVGGQTHNPYVLDRNPCGSSSGSAVAVAASLAQVAIGTETDGSIVCPAGTNGVVGIKPTLGMVSRDGIVPISAEQDTAGPIARHSIDAALTLEVIAGADPADPATEAAPADTDTFFSDLDLHALRGARVGVWDLPPGSALDPATLQVFDEAVAHLEKAGATVVHVQLPYQSEIGQGEIPTLNAEFKRDVNAYLAATPGDHPADLAGLIAFNDAHADQELQYFGQEVFLEAQASATPEEDPSLQALRDRIRDLAQRSIDETLAQGPGSADDLDAIMALTGGPAWVTKYFNTDGEADDFVYGSSSPAAVAGYPDVAVPAGFGGQQAALPIGVSFFGTGWDDADVVDLAADFEDEVDARRPPTFLPTVGPDPLPPNPEPGT